MEILNTILNWLSENYGWFISIFIQGFIAYHVFFLSKKISSKARLEHKEKIKQKADELLAKNCRDGLRNKVYLVNINRYFKDYPSNKEKVFEGYSHIRAGIKSTRFDGIEFFAELPVAIYKKQNGKLSLKGKDNEKVFTAFPVGIVPYKWIEYVDLEGDEYDYSPLFYCHFKGRIYWKKSWKRFVSFGYPYKKIIYYKESENYEDGSDPIDMKYRFIDEQILKK